MANITDEAIVVTSMLTATRELPVPVGLSLWVKDGELVTRGQQLTEGSVNLAELHTLRGKEAVQRYILKEIQYIYSSQGQKLNDKHIELIMRQMFSRVYVTEPGTTELLPGEVVTMAQFQEANLAAREAEGKVAVGEQLLLGITKASLSTDSFLSAASFQETARVLIDAAVTGRVDKLRGLKENVIIGRLIPAGTGFGPLAVRLEEAMVGVRAEQEAARKAAFAAAEARADVLAAQAQAEFASLAPVIAPEVQEMPPVEIQ